MPVVTDKNGAAYWDPHYGPCPPGSSPGALVNPGIGGIEGVDISKQTLLEELFEMQRVQTTIGDIASKPKGKTLSQEVLETLNREIALQEAELARRAEMISTLQEQLQLANQRLYEAVKLASDIMRSKLDGKEVQDQCGCSCHSH